MDLGHDYDDWVFCASQFNIYEVILLKKPHHPRIQSSFHIKALITVCKDEEMSSAKARQGKAKATTNDLVSEAKILK